MKMLKHLQHQPLKKNPVKPDATPNPKPEVKQSGAPKTDKKKDEEPAWTSNPEDKNHALIEMYIRMELDKRKGDLTKMDLEKVTVMVFIDRDPLSDLKPLSKLTKLKMLRLEFTQVTDLRPLVKKHNWRDCRSPDLRYQRIGQSQETRIR